MSLNLAEIIDEWYRNGKVFHDPELVLSEVNRDREILPCVPREVFEAMEPTVQKIILCDYWIPKDGTLPVLQKHERAYREFKYTIDTERPPRVMWNVPFERFCAYDGAKMYKCEENSEPEFYCPICKKFYADKNWDIQGD